MDAILLLKDNVDELKKHKIICWGLVQDYLLTVFSEYGLENNVVAVIDNMTKNWGIKKIHQKDIPIVSPDYLTGMDETFSLIVTCDYCDEIVEQIEREGYLRDESICKVYRYLSPIECIDLYYRKKYENQMLENIIVFRSGPIRKAYVPGTDFADNARALFEYMLVNGYNKKYKLVWMVKNPDCFAEYAAENVEFVSFDWEDSEEEVERERYYHALCLAKYIFMTDAYGFARNARKDQIRVQLWHGCGFKTRVNFSRCEGRYEYTTVVSDLYADIHADVYGLRKEQLLVTGYAKQDWLRQPYQQAVYEILGKNQMSKCIFWLPTFRMAEKQLSNLNQYEINPETGLPIVVDMAQMKALNELLAELDVLLVIKIHPFQNNMLVADFDYTNIVLLRNADMIKKDLIINRLLASADAMISDYSSAAVDYLSLERPLAFTLDDVEEYKNSRGFVFDNIQEWLPGKEIFNFDDMCDFVCEVAMSCDTSKEKREKISKKMLKYRDAYNCKRIIEALGI